MAESARVRARLGQDDHRHIPVPRPPRLARAEAPAEIGLAGDDEVWQHALREVEGAGGPRRFEHREAVRAQLALEVLPRPPLVLCEENGVRGHAPTLEPRRTRGQMSFGPVV